MKRLIPCSGATADETRLISEECTPIISTDCLVKEASYRDNSTVIFCWGRRLFNEQVGDETEEYSTSRSDSLCRPTVLRSLATVQITEASVGETHALFLSSKGKVFAYGEGAYGQLGLGDIKLVSINPELIESLPSAASKIACGDFHSVALIDDGSIFSWGAADCVGDGGGVDRYYPVALHFSDALPDFASSACRTVAARYSQSMAVTVEGRLLVWGDTFFAQYFHAPRVTFVFNRSHAIVQLAIGKHFALALTDSGVVLAWGDGTYGELAGKSHRLGRSSFEVLDIKDANGQPLPPIASVAVGARHALLLTIDSRLWAFGDNLAGQCGVPGHQTKLTNAKLVKLGELRCRGAKIACGIRHSACVTAHHQLYMWGHSSSHKLIFTAAAEGVVSKETQAGVAIRSGLKGACYRARLIYSMLHMKVTCAALGSETTIIVTGDGDPNGKVEPRPAEGNGTQAPIPLSSTHEPHIVTAADLMLPTEQSGGAYYRSQRTDQGPPQ